MQEGCNKKRLGSDQGFPACTVKAKLPEFHMIFMFDKLKLSVILPTNCIVLSVLKASGDLKIMNHSWFIVQL